MPVAMRMTAQALGSGRIMWDMSPIAPSTVKAEKVRACPTVPIRRGAHHVCVGCCSQSRIWHDFGNRSYVSGLLIGSRAVALMGLRTRLGLISGKVYDDPMGRQTLGAYLLRSMLSSLSRTPL